MPLKHIPYFPNTLEGQAILDNFARTRRVFAVGTTSLKALETAATIGGKIKPFSGWTNRFIFPPASYSNI